MRMQKNGISSKHNGRVSQQQINKFQIRGLQALLIMVFCISTLMISGCTRTGTNGGDSHQSQTSATEPNTESTVTLTQPELTEVPNDRPVATITLKGGDQIIVALYPEFAPNTVNNFISLAEEGFYDGLMFHRIISGFMIQGGDPQGTGIGGPGYSIAGEFSNNGFTNTLKHLPGVISMARSNDPDSAGSQFFICHGDATFLDGDYAAFGVVAEGMEVLDTVANVVTVTNDRPETPVIMESITIERNGYTFDKVEKIDDKQ